MDVGYGGMYDVVFIDPLAVCYYMFNDTQRNGKLEMDDTIHSHSYCDRLYCMCFCGSHITIAISMNILNGSIKTVMIRDGQYLEIAQFF